MFGLRKIFDLRKIFALPDNFLKSKNDCTKYLMSNVIGIFFPKLVAF